MRMRILYTTLFILCAISGFSQWEFYAAAPGGNIISFQQNDHIIFALTDNGLYSSSDEAASWARVPIPTSEVVYWSGLAIRDSIIVVTGSAHTFAKIKYYSLISLNGGETWSDLNLPPGVSSARVVINPYGLYAIAQNQIWVSIDFGLGWNPSEVSVYIPSLNRTHVQNNLIYIVSGKSYYRSDPHSDDWYAFSPDINGNSIDQIYDIGSVLFLKVTSPNNLYVSHDDGASWMNSSGPYERTLLQNIISLGEDYYGLYNDELYISTDVGLNWKLIANQPYYMQTSMVSSGERLIIGTDGAGVFTSDDGGLTLSMSNLGLKSGRTNRIQFHDNYLYVGCENLGVARYNTLTHTWAGTPVLPSRFALKDIIGLDASIFAIREYNQVLRSDDQGESWVDVSSSLPLQYISNFYAIGSSIFVGGHDYNNPVPLYISNDQGEQWEKYSVISDGVPYEPFSIIQTEQALFVADPKHILVSTDQGAQWTPINLEPIWQVIPDGQIVSVSASNKRLYIRVQNHPIPGHTFISTDLGLSWSLVTDGLPLHEHSPGIMVMTHDEDFFLGSVIGSEYGIFYSDDPNAPWIPLQGGLLKNQFAFDFTYDDQYVYIATGSNGIWRASLANLVSTQSFNIPSAGKLLIYPNPTTDRMTIFIDPVMFSPVRLQIYSMHGQLLAEQRIDSESGLEVNLASLSSGVYLIVVSNQTGESFSAQILKE